MEKRLFALGFFMFAAACYITVTQQLLAQATASVQDDYNATYFNCLTIHGGHHMNFECVKNWCTVETSRQMLHTMTPPADFTECVNRSHT